MSRCGVDGNQKIPPQKMHRGRAKVVLNEIRAREIFQFKNENAFPSRHACSKHLAIQHGISCKAIRDIWNGRSWLDATYHLWSEGERPQRRAIGRPKGSKDKKPRTKKSSQPLEARINSTCGHEITTRDKNSPHMVLGSMITSALDIQDGPRNLCPTSATRLFSSEAPANFSSLRNPYSGSFNNGSNAPVNYFDRNLTHPNFHNESQWTRFSHFHSACTHPNPPSRLNSISSMPPSPPCYSDHLHLFPVLYAIGLGGTVADNAAAHLLSRGMGGWSQL